MQDSAIKVVFEWPSSIYTHIKSVCKGYEQSPKLTTRMILIRPGANNQSSCTNLSDIGFLQNI